jgi:hypothetical protein
MTYDAAHLRSEAGKNYQQDLLFLRQLVLTIRPLHTAKTTHEQMCPSSPPYRYLPPKPATARPMINMFKLVAAPCERYHQLETRRARSAQSELTHIAQPAKKIRQQPK